MGFPHSSVGKESACNAGMKMKVKSSCSVVSDCRDPMDCSLPGSYDHGIFQARVLEWVAISGFNSYVGKIPWRRNWQPTPVFLPGESHGKGFWQATVRGFARIGHDLATKPGLPW